MTVLQAVIEGMIQGATEFLPVSSSGHLSLSQHFLGIQQPGLFFDVMLHLGTLLAVIAVYHRLVGRLLCELLSLLRDLFTGRFRRSRMTPDRRLLLMLFVGLLPLFLLFLPVPGTGRKLKDFADLWATDGDILIEGFSLIGTAVLLTLGIFSSHQNAVRSVSLRRPGSRPYSGRKEFRPGDAVTVGLFQCAAALFPGLSRSGSTLSAGLMRGINRKAALDYSFVIGIPSILAAAALELKDAPVSPSGTGTAAVFAGVLTAAAVGFLAIQLLRWVVKTDRLWIFVFYTLILGIFALTAGFIEHRTGVNLATGAKLNF